MKARIASVEVPLACERALGDQAHVFARVEGFEFVARGSARLDDPGALVEATRRELGIEGRVPVRTEGMAVAKSVAREAFARHHQHR